MKMMSEERNEIDECLERMVDICNKNRYNSMIPDMRKGYTDIGLLIAQLIHYLKKYELIKKNSISSMTIEERLRNIEESMSEVRMNVTDGHSKWLVHDSKLNSINMLLRADENSAFKTTNQLIELLENTRVLTEKMEAYEKKIDENKSRSDGVEFTLSQNEINVLEDDVIELKAIQDECLTQIGNLKKKIDELEVKIGEKKERNDEWEVKIGEKKERNDEWVNGTVAELGVGDIFKCGCKSDPISKVINFYYNPHTKTKAIFYLCLNGPKEGYAHCVYLNPEENVSIKIKK
jgi:septation ring formation regulator EzrA